MGQRLVAGLLLILAASPCWANQTVRTGGTIVVDGTTLVYNAGVFSAGSSGGALTGASLALTPVAAGLGNGLTVTQSSAGTVSSAINFLNSIVVNNENINAGANLLATTLIQTNVSGTSTRADNANFSLMADMQVNTISASAGQPFGALMARAIAKTSTTTSTVGVEGANVNVAINGGVTGIQSIAGIETDMDVAAGANPVNRFGYETALASTDAVQGSGRDASFFWDMQPGTSPGWKNAFLLDGTNGTILDATVGCILCTMGTRTIASAIDTSTWTLTGNFFKSANAILTGAGHLGIGINTTPLAVVDIKGATNEHMLIAGHDHLASGVAFRGVNDAANANIQLEIEATNWEFTNANVPSLDFGVTTASTLTSTMAATFTNAAVKMTAITTGTNADTVCLKADGTLLIQAAACTISSERFKNIWEHHLDNKEALLALANLTPVAFTLKGEAVSTRDSANSASLQLGLTAENVAAVEPRCSIWEDDGVTPKSYRPECIVALLVQGHQAQDDRLNTVFALLLLLSGAILIALLQP